MKKLVIDRSNWRTGGNGEYQTGKKDTSLLNESGYMCCLGFAALDCGFKEEDIRMIGEPGSIDIDVEDIPKDNYIVDIDYEEGLIHNNQLSAKAMEINDDMETTPEDKEKLLTELFKEHDIELEFIGEFEKQEP